MGHPPRPRSCSLLLVCRVQAPPLEHLSQDASGRPDSVSDSESDRCDQEGLEPSPLLQLSMTSQSKGCFHSHCSAQHRTLGFCSQRFGSGTRKKHFSHVGTVESLGVGSIDTASEGARIRYPSRPLGTNHEREGCELGGDAGATGLGGLTSLLLARRRGFSTLADEACDAAFKSSAGGSSEIATNASVQQYRDVGVPRNSQQQLSMSHHLTTVINSIFSPIPPTLHDFVRFLQRDFPQTRACLLHRASCR